MVTGWAIRGGRYCLRRNILHDFCTAFFGRGLHVSPNGFFALYSPREKWAISHNWGQRDGMMLHCCCQEEMGTTYIFRMQSHKTLHDDVVVVLWCIQDCIFTLLLLRPTTAMIHTSSSPAIMLSLTEPIISFPSSSSSSFSLFSYCLLLSTRGRDFTK